MSAHDQPLFANYTQLPAYLPLPAWHALRMASVVLAIGLSLLLYLRPEIGLFLVWKVVMPVMPLVFLMAPGIWRNACPLAALNQTPRLLGFTKGLTQTPLIKEYSYVIGIVLCFALISGRKFLFNQNGAATALLIVAALVGAFLGGVIFKGKSGWCSSICPLLPVQRLYGQTPFLLVANSHCQPCVGCTKNCYDFNPSVANLADQYDEDRHYTGYRRFFAASFPGFILAFYLVPNPPDVSIAAMYLQFAFYMAISLAVFSLLDTFAKTRANTLTALYASAALNMYYWFNSKTLMTSAGTLMDATLPEWPVWALRVGVLGVTLIWLYRTFATERKFVAHAISAASGQNARLGAGSAKALQQAAQKERSEVVFMPDEKHVAAEQGQTVLEVIEHCGLSIESGCRMGICGADPVAILDGMENLSPIGADEGSTLARLGYAENTRMACCARINGRASVALAPEKRKAVASGAAAENYDASIKRVVVIGNGIAGVTAADHIRRHHPKCEIHLIGKEKHALYNRMGIARLIYGRSAMQGLYLLPDAWYDEHDITCWLNTHADRIDTAAQQVHLATGEQLDYDRLILATGSSSFVPPIEGYGVAGTFVLREADDAMHIRDYAQRRRARHAVVAGGGLLGLEAAYALHKLGLEVSVLERAKWPLQRQVDAKGGALLENYLNGLGMKIVVDAETAAIAAEDGHVSAVSLKDGRTLPCDVFLVCAGISPNVALAQAAGLQARRGVIVDAAMRTSADNVFAVGDVAEYAGQVYGLWPAAVEQAEIAALNAVGSEREYKGTVSTTMLKVVGAELMSIGRFEPASEDDSVIALEDIESHRYRKLVISGNKIAGAILIGYPLEGPIVARAIKEEQDITACLDDLRAGNWTVLDKH